MAETYRQRVVRADGRTINVVQRRAHLSYCFSGCCCGRTERGYAAVPVDTYKSEWLRRKLRQTVHLTKGGCLGPCALANVATLVFDGRAVWFHSINTPWHVRLIFDYIDLMLRADRFVAPPGDLAELVFNFYDWDARPRDEAPAERPARAGDVQIALLTHADTDLLALRHARALLPAELHVTGLSLLGLRSDEQMQLWLEGELAHTPIVVLRLHGELEGVPGFDRLARTCGADGRHLVIVSGTGERRPDFARASRAPLDVVEAVTTYLLAGGAHNVAECLKYVADRLLLTGYGADPPTAVPDHGIYLRDVEAATLDDWMRRADPSRPTVAILFYRAHLSSGNVAFVDAIVDAVEARGLNALPIFTSSLRARDGDLPAALALAAGRADAIISTLSFALADADSSTPAFAQLDVPVIQAIASGMAREAWDVSRRGLTALDTAINVAIPELDGRIIAVPSSFKERVEGAPGQYAPDLDRVERVAGLAAAQVRLRHRPRADVRVAFILTNSSAKASQVGNAVGLDAPASLLNLLRAMRGRGYRITGLPPTSDALMDDLLARGTYDERHPLDDGAAQRFSREQYHEWFGRLTPVAREKMEASWGVPTRRGFTLPSTPARVDRKIAPRVAAASALPTEEPWSDATDYHFATLELGHALVALQPPRGYGMNPDAIYHTPDLPPTHHYAAFYRWLAAPRADGGWGADAIVHVGKHGTLEWLPGKGVGLSADCFPDALLGDLPLVYPFIVNDPGEGSQAKRRAHAVIVDHLMPAMTNAELYGPLATLNDLVNEYYAVEKLDPLKLPILQQQIWELIRDAGLRRDLDLRAALSRDHGDHRHEWDDELTAEGVPVTLTEMSGNEVAHLVEDLDGYLCELGTAQIRDGLHVLGEMPALADTLRALTRLSNAGAPGLQEAIARLLGFDLPALLDAPGGRLEPERVCAGTTCRTHADVLERIEALSRDLFERLDADGFQPAAVARIQSEVLGTPSSDVERALRFACDTLVPALERVSGEVQHVLDALEGRYVAPGPSGAPTRGMAHVLPTGRNFYGVDPRALPSQAAWRVGQQLATEVIERHRREEGRYPEMIGLGAWGTSQMRTQGDDVAEVLALMGVEPVWESRSRRIADVAVVPLERLGRPRIDVTLRISGFFRDAFPHLIALVDRAIELVVSQDEPPEWNFPRKHYLADLERGAASPDRSPEEIESRARYRIFGAKPGSYGAGIQHLVDTRHWEDDRDLAAVFVEWGGYAYGRDADGADARDVFADRLRAVEVAVHNQDNREHDIFDADDYYQFHGGMIASVRSLSGKQPKAYVGDSARPDAARVRDLREEALRVYRSRVVNPKWLAAIQRHGYKGGLELAATVDYIFGFDATAHVAPDFVYEGLAAEYALSPDVQAFLLRANPWALHAIADRLLEAADRELWEHPSAETLASLREAQLSAETAVEARGERARVAP